MLSVLSVEPYGMKPKMAILNPLFCGTFSALGRAVWDETLVPRQGVLAVAPFSALGRAVWDETVQCGRGWRSARAFSALGRAVWDETPGPVAWIRTRRAFQCSRSSRMG